MLLFVLGVGDVLVAMALLSPHLFPPFLATLLVGFSLLKGSWSILTSLGVGYKLDWMGALDLLAGLCLFLLHKGFTLNIYWWIGVMLALKGVWSVIIGFMR
jgi:hypothetical protein